MMEKYELHLGNSLEVLKTLPDNSVDAIVTDPPYGLSKEPDMLEVLRHWMAGDDYKHGGGGFMGKSWDSFVPGPAIWRECMRVLKPGGHLLAFFGTRTQDMGTLAIRLAGFEIRDSIAWVYGSGFPKSHNLEGEWQGWGTALKPALEPITVARKPLAKGHTVAANVLACGTGALNIDGCRVSGSVDDVNNRSRKNIAEKPIENAIYNEGWKGSGKGFSADLGRFPANLIHDGSDEVIAAFPFTKSHGNGEKRVNANAGAAVKNNIYNGGWIGVEGTIDRNDSGSAARFFYCAKASKRDRDEGLEGFTHATVSDGRAVAADNAYQRGATERANIHPTVKPTDLMRYLCRLVTPPGGLVLDPFMGSGSTGKAAMLEGFRFIGIDITPEYVEIAKARIEYAMNNLDKQISRS